MNKVKPYLTAFVLSLAAFCFIGCAAIDRNLYSQKVETIPGEVIRTNTTFLTNVVVTPSYTNSAGNIVAAEARIVIEPTVTYDYSPPVTVTNLVPKQVVKTATDVVGALPVPFAGTAAVFLGWLYTGYAAIRNRRVSAALVQGIEAGRKILQETPEGQRLDAKVKDLLIHHQEVSGVLDAASRLVNRYTGDTVAAH